jgi:hypothetical protein
MAAGSGMALVASGVRKRGYSRRLCSARYLQIPAALPGATGKRRQGPVSSDRTPVALRVAQDLREYGGPAAESPRQNRPQCWWMWALLRRLLPAHGLHVAQLRIDSYEGPFSLRLRLTPCACALSCGQASAGTSEHPEDVRPLRCRGRGLWPRWHGSTSHVVFSCEDNHLCALWTEGPPARALSSIPKMCGHCVLDGAVFGRGGIGS